MLVLALDTSTPSVTAAVVRLRQPHDIVVRDIEVHDIDLLAEERVTDPYAHAERLMPLATAALAAAGCALRDLDAVVVGLGPGPFTGLRVGIATAAALGDGLGIDVYGVPSHDGTARAVASLAPTKMPGDLLVVTDARRREVYLSAYRPDGSRVLGPLVIPPAAVPEMLAEHGLAPSHVSGAGTALLEADRGPGFDPTVLDNAAVSIGLGLVQCAAGALLTGAIPGPLTPLYLRRPDATEPGARKSVLGR